MLPLFVPPPLSMWLIWGQEKRRSERHWCSCPGRTPHWPADELRELPAQAELWQKHALTIQEFREFTVHVQHRQGGHGCTPLTPFLVLSMRLPNSRMNWSLQQLSSIPQYILTLQQQHSLGYILMCRKETTKGYSLYYLANIKASSSCPLFFVIVAAYRCNPRPKWCFTWNSVHPHAKPRTCPEDALR